MTELTQPGSSTDPEEVAMTDESGGPLCDCCGERPGRLVVTAEGDSCECATCSDACWNTDLGESDEQ